jgi:hypothetical protein
MRYSADATVPDNARGNRKPAGALHCRCSLLNIGPMPSYSHLRLTPCVPPKPKIPWFFRLDLILGKVQRCRYFPDALPHCLFEFAPFFLPFEPGVASKHQPGSKRDLWEINL